MMRAIQAVAVVLLHSLAACSFFSTSVVPVDFSRLDGWKQDDHEKALTVFLQSCQNIEATEHTVGGVAISNRDWQRACEAASMVPTRNKAAARQYFENNFIPYAVRNECWQRKGLFTGYYEPALRGALEKSETYRYPLYALPDIAQENMPDRSAIDAGALSGKGVEIAWVDDPVALFFLHIQGSGRLLLGSGEVLRVGYAGKNGHPYHAIGRTLVEKGYMVREAVSAPSIMRWLTTHPNKMWDIMHTNPSYVFFRILKEEGPLGAEGVALTPGRSLAIDHKEYPYGLPFWLETSIPPVSGEQTGKVFSRLMVGQDTGSAIIGAVRGDVFFGYGNQALAYAGNMKQPGTLYVLLPKQEESLTGE